MLKKFPLLSFLLIFSACAPEGPVLADRPDALGQPVARSGIGATLNAERTARRLPRLGSSGRLTRAAQGHANDMSSNGHFSHRGSDGRDLGERVRSQGYGYCVLADNIAQGQRDVSEVVRVWMASPGHRRNILNPQVTEFGIGRAAGSYWVLVLARPGC